MAVAGRARGAERRVVVAWIGHTAWAGACARQARPVSAPAIQVLNLHLPKMEGLQI